MTKPELTNQVKFILLNAAKQDSDLWGGSPLDLCADQLPAEDLQDLKCAIAKAFYAELHDQGFSLRVESKIREIRFQIYGFYYPASFL